MKRAIACLLALCLLVSALGGCAPAGGEAPVESTPPAESTPPIESTPSVESTPPAESTPPVESETPEPGPSLDYSGHDDPNEADYVTELIDLDTLGDGGAHLVRETIARGSIWPFEGMVKGEIWGYDLRCQDVREADLSVVKDWNDVSFSSDTIWPDDLPEGFSPEDILEYNKNPGLSIRDLHKQGYTGKGVGIAIIDQGLYTGHEEYAENLKSYELIHCSDLEASMHGAAVASIAVGKTVGVAPEANLYYIGSTFGHFTGDGYVFNASIMADCILRVCEMNRHLSQGDRIRVISISKGYAKGDPGYNALQRAIRKADEQGILVLTTSTGQFYRFNLVGLSRSYFDDPDDPASYRPTSRAPTGDFSMYGQVCVPMGSRAYASWNGPQDYEIVYNAGMSWAVPWLAGFYALCCQAKPEITPAEFVEEIIYNVRVYSPPTGGKVNILDPAAVIARLTK